MRVRYFEQAAVLKPEIFPGIGRGGPVFYGNSAGWRFFRPEKFSDFFQIFLKRFRNIFRNFSGFFKNFFSVENFSRDAGTSGNPPGMYRRRKSLLPS